MMDIQKLKPCPFCGGASLRFDTDTVHPDNIHMAWVECNGDECECRGPCAFWFDDMSEAKTNAAELWNKRAAPPAPIGLPRVNHPAQFDYADKVAEILKANNLKVVGHEDE